MSTPIRQAPPPGANIHIANRNPNHRVSVSNIDTADALSSDGPSRSRSNSTAGSSTAVSGLQTRAMSMSNLQSATEQHKIPHRTQSFENKSQITTETTAAAVDKKAKAAASNVCIVVRSLSATKFRSKIQDYPDLYAHGGYGVNTESIDKTSSPTTSFSASKVDARFSLENRFKLMKEISSRHKNLCKYLDLLPGHFETHYLVSLQYRTTLLTEILYCIGQKKRTASARVYKVTLELFSALLALHKHDIIYTYLTPLNIFLDNEGSVKLGDFAFFQLLREFGNEVNTMPFRGTVPYLAPEIFACEQQKLDVLEFLSPEVDTWSAGVILLRFVLGNKFAPIVEVDAANKKTDDSGEDAAPTEATELKQNKTDYHNGAQIYAKLNQFVKFCRDDSISKDAGAKRNPNLKPEFVDAWKILRSFDPDFRELLLSCLSTDVTERPTIEDLLNSSPFFNNIGIFTSEQLASVSPHDASVFRWIPKPILKCALESAGNDNSKATTVLTDRNINNTSRSTAVQEELIDEYFEWKELCLSTTGTHVSEYFESREDLEVEPVIFRLEACLFSEMKIMEGQRHADRYKDNFIFSSSIERLQEQRKRILSDEELPTQHIPMQADVNKNALSIRALTLREWIKKLKLREQQKLQSSDVVQVGDLKEVLINKKRPTKRYSVLEGIIGDDAEPTKSSEPLKLKSRPSFANLLSPNETDLEYQKKRVKLFRRLLLDYPATRNEIIKQAKIDIPGMLRGEIWAAILGIGTDLEVQQEYDAIDKEQPTVSDRQISVDIPRCHQYNRLLSSPEGRRKLMRILKTWVITETGLVYWQGLDSLAAPFLTLNFHHEARAFACLKHVVNHYVYQFFMPDNSEGMESRLALFQQLITYHDPELSCHLLEIGFVPELYAIPWFLTIYSHVLPLEKVYRLWDRLFLGSPHMAVYFGISFLKQMRQYLLNADFNSTMVFFSNLQAVDIRKSIEDSENIAAHTPPSVVEPIHIKFGHKDEELRLDIPRREWEELITPAQYKEEACTRVSAFDLQHHLMPLAVVIDIRDEDDYQRLHCATPTIHIPRHQIQDRLLPAVEFKRGLPIVIISNHPHDAEYAFMVAKMLVTAKYPYVSVVSGGMQAIAADTTIPLVRN